MSVTISNTGKQTINRALASGWVPSNGIIGPGRFNRSTTEERKNLRAIFAKNKRPSRYAGLELV
jgi:hypothetical protein